MLVMTSFYDFHFKETFPVISITFKCYLNDTEAGPHIKKTIHLAIYDKDLKNSTCAYVWFNANIYVFQLNRTFVIFHDR